MQLLLNRFRMRLSSSRLNVTRLGEGPAAVTRTAARASLGSASSDIKSIQRLLSFQASFQKLQVAEPVLRLQLCPHDRANSGWLQGAMLRTTPGKGRAAQKGPRHAIVSAIIMPPHFRPSPAVRECEKNSVRWPGPFGSGFLSPQPPGVVRIGPVPQPL